MWIIMISHMLNDILHCLVNVIGLNQFLPLGQIAGIRTSDKTGVDTACAHLSCHNDGNLLVGTVGYLTDTPFGILGNDAGISHAIELHTRVGYVAIRIKEQRSADHGICQSSQQRREEHSVHTTQLCVV